MFLNVVCHNIYLFNTCASIVYDIENPGFNKYQQTTVILKGKSPREGRITQIY